MTILRAVLTAALTTLLLAPTGTAYAAARTGTHDAFSATVRLPDHGACRIAKSDAAVRATLTCPDGWRRAVRPCPQEDSSRCFWHAPTRGDGRGTSFVALAGRHHYFRG